MKALIISALAILSLGLTACDEDSTLPIDSGPGVQAPGGDETPAQSPDTPDPATEPSDGVSPEASFDPAEWHTFEAGPFTVPAGEERYLCFSETLDEDLWVDNITVVSKPVVHHVVYSQTTSPDPEGVWECDVLFQNNWMPVFVAGTGDASLTMPEGAGHVLKKGTQLTVQLHLLNATMDDVTETVPIHLRKLSAEPENPVQVVVFGSTSIALPPGESADVVSHCSSDSNMTLFSVFPHMHLLAQKMIVEAGPDDDSMVEIFRSDPYDFDQQSLSPLDLRIEAGDRVRVTCSYDNHLDQTVTFGESTTNEMCFFIGFATEATHQFAGCIGGSGAEDFVPEGCGSDPPNDIGLGASCTAGGGECASGLMCTEDVPQMEGINTCIGMGCEASADCGQDGVCCSIPAAGDVTLCLPPSCAFSICEILE